MTTPHPKQVLLWILVCAIVATIVMFATVVRLRAEMCLSKIDDAIKIGEAL